MTAINAAITETVATTTVPVETAAPAAAVSAPQPPEPKLNLRDIAQALAEAASRETAIKAELDKLLLQHAETHAVAAAAAATAAESAKALSAAAAATDAKLASMVASTEAIKATMPTNEDLSAAMAAISAGAAAPAPAAKTEWMDSTAVRIGLGVAAAGLVAGVGYFAYSKFFGGSNAAEA